MIVYSWSLSSTRATKYEERNGKETEGLLIASPMHISLIVVGDFFYIQGC